MKAAAKGRRLIGLDPGQRRIGIALSDPDHRVATPHKVLLRSGFSRDAAAILAVVETYEAGGLVIGYPLDMDGGAGPRAQSGRAFQRNLEQHIALPMLLQDERFSTVAAERGLIALDVSRRRRAQIIDAHAAAHILQGVLDAV